MKISLTGHTKGIGKGIVDALCDEHEIIGFSRSNGYDISLGEARDQIVKESKECDVFINNAFDLEAQFLLFDMFYDKWYHDSSKTIININSIVRHVKNSRNPIYKNYKVDLHERSLGVMLDLDRRCKIINVSPGRVDTDMIKSLNLPDEDMLSPAQFAEYIKWLLSLPPDIEVCELSLNRKRC